MKFKGGPVFLFLLGILVLPHAVAEELRDCSVKALTENCTKLPEKSKMNPWRMEQGSLIQARESMDVTMDQGYGMQMDPEKAIEFQNVVLKVQSELLSKISKGSPVFKLAISSPMTLQTLSYALTTAEESPQAYINPIPLPWPPDDPNAGVKEVSFKDFKTRWWDKLSNSERKLLNGKMKELSEASAKFYQTSDPEVSGPSEEELLAEKIKQSKIQDLKKQQQSRVKKLFKQAQKYLVEEIKARPFTSKENEKKLIEKLKTIKFTGIESGTSRCGQDTYNAFYSPDDHSFTICSGMADVNDMGVLLVVGHELGHSIDPCYSQNGVFKVATYNDQKVKDYFAKQGMNETNNEMLRKALKAAQPQEVSGNLNSLLSYKQTRDLEKMGVLTTLSEGVEGAYPLDTVSRCLRDGYQLFDGETSGDSLAEKRIQRLKAIQPEIFDSAPWSLSRCSLASELNEAMADVFGAKVLARYAADHGKTSFKELQLSLESYFPNACSDQSLLLVDNHPFHKERIEKIVTADPLMKKVFHCKEAQGARSYCMNKFGHSTIPSKAPVKTPDPADSRSVK